MNITVFLIYFIYFFRTCHPTEAWRVVGVARGGVAIGGGSELRLLSCALLASNGRTSSAYRLHIFCISSAYRLRIGGAVSTVLDFFYSISFYMIVAII